MINKRLQDALNYQINREIYSAYFYLGMAAYAFSIGLGGFANWFGVQFKEELTHAEKIFDYLIQRNGKVTLRAIEEPPQDFTSGVDLFKRTLEHEKRVTKMIIDLVDLAKSENDRKTEGFLQWFIKEQAGEEEAPAKILQKIELAGNDRESLLKIDKELTKRK